MKKILNELSSEMKPNQNFLDTVYYPLMASYMI